MKKYFIFLILIFYTVSQGQEKEVKKEWDEFFKENKVLGCIVIYDMNNNKYIRCNPKRCSRKFIPASTFKIPNSLIGLESGVIPDENYVIKWDSVVRQIPDWNMDHTLQSAIKVSALWYYQELARRVGEGKMKEYLKKMNYGNKDISGGIDAFWLLGGMRISPDEQVEFLKKLYLEKLPFSKRNIDIVKKIIIRDKTDKYIIHAKTGHGVIKDINYGWYVGWLEENNNVYFFATNIESNNPDKNFRPCRIDITYKAFKSLGLMK